MTVNIGRTAYLQPDRSGRQHLKIMQLLASVEADSDTPLVETLIATLGRLRRGMTLVVITPSVDPSWVRPLGSLRARGVGCVVLFLDGGAFDRFAGSRKPGLVGDVRPPLTEVSDEVAKRARALRHTLAEYELASFTITPGRPLGEILGR
jgi:hypothetical protein